MPEKIYDEPVEFAKKLLVALCFEQYLRFYFLDVDDDADFDSPAVLSVPDNVVAQIKKENSELMPLLNDLQGKAITFEESRSAVIDQAAYLMGLSPHDSSYRQMAAEVSVSEFFQDELLEFHSWVQEMDETQDYTEVIPFNNWLDKYRTWREHIHEA